MTEITKTGILALVTGSSGSSAHFSGRISLGWSLLLLNWVLLPSFIWALRTYSAINPSMLVFIFLCIILAMHIGLFIYHRKTKAPEQTMAMVSSRKWRVLLSLIFMALLGWAANTWAFNDPKIDTSKTTPVYELNSLVFSEAFLTDEDAFRKKYDRKVVRITGKVHSLGEDFSEGAYLALESAPGSPADVNCYFLAERQGDILNIATGDVVTVTGVADGQFLRNCYLHKGSK